MSSVSELVEPRSAEEAGDVLVGAASAGRTVSLARSGGDVVVSTAALDRVIEHEATDLTCVLEAGVRLSQLDAALVPHGQQLSLDPPGDPTIGECILDALSGPRRHRYGAVRDLILGVTVVLVDGTVASSGGKVVKNVAGYDLAKLFCGSRGRLGLVVRAAFRLHPRPQSDASVEVRVARAQDAADTVRALQRSTLVPSALDVSWPDRVLALFEGSAAVVAAQRARAASLVGAAEVDDEVWSEVRERQAAAAGVLAFAPGELGQLLNAEGAALARPSLGIAYVDRPVQPDTSVSLSALRERVRHEFDPNGVLVG